MAWNLDRLRRGLLAVLLLVNLFAPLQKVFACVTFDGAPMSMAEMACCPEAVSVGDDRYADIERRILSSDSCCVLTVETTAAELSTQHNQAAETALKQVMDALWHVLPVLFDATAAIDPDGAAVASPPPHDLLAGLTGIAIFAATARLRI